MRNNTLSDAGLRRPTSHRAKSVAELDQVLGSLAGRRCALPEELDPGLETTGLSQDSRSVRPGDLYLALPGARWHGASFGDEAAARGAVVAVSDTPVPGLTTFVVPQPRRVAGQLATWLYGNPSRQLDVYGVTGTNGKTSTTHLLHAGLSAAGHRPGLLSGIEIRGLTGSRPSVRTTPEAAELQAELACLREDGARSAALEVSSHGLALHRVDGTFFRAAVFTNLGLDHLDLHGDVEGYFAAKASLFQADRCALAVVNIDDPYGRRLAAQATIPVVTFSPSGAPADYRALDIDAGPDTTRFTVRGPGGPRSEEHSVALRLLGRHQVDNCLAALAAAGATGIALADAIAGMQGLSQVPGRLERIDTGQPFLAVVDYAHNTAGHQRLFPYLRSVSDGRVHVVVGITGERDPGKRAPLGRSAATYADTVVVTDESPHSEDPAALRDAIAAGAREAGGARVLIEPDRAQAIRVAVACARPGDVVAVVGRGHDQQMVTGSRVEHFDDRAALREALLQARTARSA